MMISCAPSAKMVAALFAMSGTTTMNLRQAACAIP